MKLWNWAEPSPIELAEQQVDRCRRKAADLHLQLRDSERQLADAKQAAISEAMEFGHLNDDNLELASHTASVEILRAAVAKAQADLADAEQQLAEAKDAEQRSKSVAIIERLQQDMRGPCERLLGALQDLVPLTKRAGSISLDAAQVVGLLETLSLELPAGLATMSAALSAHAAAIKSGQTRAHLPSIDEPKPAVTRVPPPLGVSIFPLHDVKWTDSAGQPHHAAKYIDIGVTRAVADRAIAAGVCVASSDPKAKELRPLRTGLLHDFGRLVDLDLDPPSMTSPPEIWIDPVGKVRVEPAIKASAPLVAVTGKQDWVRPTHPPTNTENY